MLSADHRTPELEQASKRGLQSMHVVIYVRRVFYVAMPRCAQRSSNTEKYSSEIGWQSLTPSLGMHIQQGKGLFLASFAAHSAS